MSIASLTPHLNYASFLSLCLLLMKDEADYLSQANSQGRKEQAHDSRFSSVDPAVRLILNSFFYRIVYLK